MDSLFMLFQKKLNPWLYTSKALKIIKNGLKMKKLWSPKIKGV
jgi:hypothetical protein